MLRLDLDSITALSGLLWGGTPRRLIAAAQATQIILLSGAPPWEKLGGLTSREKFARPLAMRGLKA